MKYNYCLCLFLLFSFYAKAQDDAIVADASKDSLYQQQDLIDVFKKIIGSKKVDTVQKTSSFAILPAIGYNPSIGFMLGINFLKTFRKGDPATTKLSASQFDASATSKKLVIIRLRSNIFTKDNKWNFQSNWQYMRYYINDFGLDGDARRDPAVNYPLRFNYLRFTEKIYKNLGHNLYGGLGVSIDLRNDIHDEKLDSTNITPHYQYSIDKGFNPNNYLVNGLMFNLQYNTKEHPNRPYKGMYADMYVRYNTKVLGSTKESGQLYTELRKYLSLSQKNPEHVLAFWYWGSYLIWGKLPYIELPSTAYDTYNRSGRGYTLGRFRGPSFVDLEAEWRFPISQTTKLLSGVLFTSFQSASNADNNGLFKYWEPAAGAGLRILFTKKSRSNICLDYARGRYGSSGIFFALNEAF